MTQVRALGPEDDLASMFLQVQPPLPGQRPQKPGASGFSQPCCPGRGLLFGTTRRRGERAPGPANRLEPWLPSSEFGDPDKLRNPSCLNVLFRKIRLRVAPTLAPLSREGSRGPSLLPLSWQPGSSWHVPSPCPDPEKQAAGLHPHTQLPPEWPRRRTGAFCGSVETGPVLCAVCWRVGSGDFQYAQPCSRHLWLSAEGFPHPRGNRGSTARTPSLPGCHHAASCLCLASSRDACVRGTPQPVAPCPHVFSALLTHGLAAERSASSSPLHTYTLAHTPEMDPFSGGALYPAP